MKRQRFIFVFFIICTLFCVSCGSKNNATMSEFGNNTETATDTDRFSGQKEAAIIKGSGLRGSKPSSLQPSADGNSVYQNETAVIDYSNCADGYFMVQYLGTCPKVKLQLIGPDNITYTYNLTTSPDAFPLSAGSGAYNIAIYENITGNQYSTALSTEIEAAITNPFGAFLYPNQYVTFTPENKACKMAVELAEYSDSDLDVISNVYNYIISHISYDIQKAENIQSGYIPDIDAVLEAGTGICLDYACLMAAMLRSQSIPTQVEVGYVGEAYHAWISTYVEDIGWINGIIQFNGQDWQLMDPTTAAANGDEELEKFIGDGSHYLAKYIY